MKMNTKFIREKIENLVDASRNQTLKELKAIKHIGVDNEREIVILIITIGEAGGPNETRLRHELAKIIKLDLGFKGIKIQFEEEKKIINQKTKFIIIESGKGGVGKSVITANLAYALTRQNKKVGIIDADIYGSSIPDILEMDIQTPEIDENERIIPFKKFGIDVVSTEFFAEKDKPILWRGSQLKSLLSNFFFKVAWDKEIEFILIDAPSGTGDVMLDLKLIVPSSEVILVTTPHTVDSHITTKTGFGALELNHKIIGVIENMAYYVNPSTNQKEFLFNEGGAEEVAKKLNTEVLATIPICPPKKHISLYESDELIGQIFDDLATLLIIR
jgi:ATP-binding protein involved in chromosome partitioning